MPGDIEEAGPEHVRALLVAEREPTSATFAQQHYRNPHVYFCRIEGEGERRRQRS
jgi:hypothetical protein